MNNQTCCFFGHRDFLETEELKNLLFRIVENLILNKNVDTFLFGSKSKFDKTCLEVVTKLKEKYSHIKRIYVRASYQHIDDKYKNYLLETYDDTYFPQRVQNAGKASYVLRNYEMIDNSTFCLCYYDENYLPQKRKNTILNDYQSKSGTAIAYDYAVRKKLFIINIFTMKE